MVNVRLLKVFNQRFSRVVARAGSIDRVSTVQVMKLESVAGSDSNLSQRTKLRGLHCLDQELRMANIHLRGWGPEALSASRLKTLKDLASNFEP